VIVCIHRFGLRGNEVHGTSWNAVAGGAEQFREAPPVDARMEFNDELRMLISKCSGHSLEHIQFHALDVDLHPVDAIVPERMPPIIETEDMDTLAALAAETVVGHPAVHRDRYDSNTSRTTEGKGHDRNLVETIKGARLVQASNGGERRLKGICMPPWTNQFRERDGGVAVVCPDIEPSLA
jgi:hypothetical protein